MHKIIKNKQSLLEWLSDEENLVKEILLQGNIRKHLQTSVEILDEYYGSERDIEKDMGGYVVVFYGEPEEVEEQSGKHLEGYHLREDDYEFEDIYETETGGKRVVFRLYLCSSDYSVLVINIYGRNQ